MYSILYLGMESTKIDMGEPNSLLLSTPSTQVQYQRSEYKSSLHTVTWNVQIEKLVYCATETREVKLSDIKGYTFVHWSECRF